MAKPKIPNLGGMNMNAMLRQAQKLQADMEKAREELDTREYEAGAGGVVTAAVNGKYELVRLTIASEAIDPEDAEMLSDMISLAVNGAIKAAREDEKTTMGRYTNGMNVGGLL